MSSDARAQQLAAEILQANTDVTATLAQVVREHLGIVTLERTKRDSLPFHKSASSRSLLHCVPPMRWPYLAGSRRARTDTAAFDVRRRARVRP
jgi:hypothetical protein